jgi:hypothetical protein
VPRIVAVIGFAPEPIESGTAYDEAKQTAASETKNRLYTHDRIVSVIALFSPTTIPESEAPQDQSKALHAQLLI